MWFGDPSNRNPLMYNLRNHSYTLLIIEHMNTTYTPRPRCVSSIGFFGMLLWIITRTISSEIGDVTLHSSAFRHIVSTVITKSSERISSSSPSHPPTPSPPTQIVWKTLESLLDESSNGYTIAVGCPPQPFVCRLHDLFDEIVVMSLPRFTKRYTRTIAQLDAMGVPYTLVHARDGRSPDALALANAWMVDSRDQTANIFSLYLTQLGILDYFLKSPMKRILLLEDDVLFRADFPSAFDRAARNLPDEWAAWWLGVNMRDGYTLAEPQPQIYPSLSGLHIPTLPHNIDTLEPILRHAGFYGAFAAGFHRDVAHVIKDTMLRNRTVIDTESYIQVLRTWPNTSFLTIPPVAIMDIATDSTLRPNVVGNTTFWNRVNHIDYSMFDAEHGYHKDGESGLLFRSKVLVGLDRVGRDYLVLPAEQMVDCLEHCKVQWPTCKAWSWNPAVTTCWLKYVQSSPISSEPTVYTGIIWQEDIVSESV